MAAVFQMLGKYVWLKNIFYKMVKDFTKTGAVSFIKKMGTESGPDVS